MIKPVLGIPTRDRPDILNRCVSSYSSLVEEGNLWIVDDSRSGLSVSSQQHGDKNDSLIHFITRARRKQIAIDLSRHTGCPTALTQFALLGNQSCALSYGASRNTLLLAAAGQLLLMVDDDTICYPSRPGIHSMDRTEYSPGDPCKYSFFETMEEALLTGEAIDPAIYLELHTKVLGKRVENETNREKIVVTIGGTRGDSGMFGHAFRLYENGAGMDPTIMTKRGFISKMTTRYLSRVAPRLTVTTDPFTIANNIGLYLKDLLPPFMPVQRNEDGVFGCLLFASFPEYLVAHIPCTIQHIPKQQRPPSTLMDSLVFRGLRVNDLLCQLILHNRDNCSSLTASGNFFYWLSTLPPDSFQLQIIQSAIYYQKQLIKWAEAQLNTSPEAPVYWIKGIQLYINSAKKAVSEESMSIAIDLPGSPQDRLALFQNLVAQYGQLLLHWPTLYEAARDMPHLFR